MRRHHTVCPSRYGPKQAGLEEAKSICYQTVTLIRLFTLKKMRTVPSVLLLCIRNVVRWGIPLGGHSPPHDAQDDTMQMIVVVVVGCEKRPSSLCEDRARLRRWKSSSSPKFTQDDQQPQSPSYLPPPHPPPCSQFLATFQHLNAVNGVKRQCKVEFVSVREVSTLMGFAAGRHYGMLPASLTAFSLPISLLGGRLKCCWFNLSLN